MIDGTVTFMSQICLQSFCKVRIFFNISLSVSSTLRSAETRRYIFGPIFFSVRIRQYRLVVLRKVLKQLTSCFALLPVILNLTLLVHCDASSLLELNTSLTLALHTAGCLERRCASPNNSSYFKDVTNDPLCHREGLLDHRSAVSLEILLCCSLELHVVVFFSLHFLLTTYLY